MTIYHFNDMDAQMRGLCDAVRGNWRGFSARGRAVLAVPGGRTPAPFFEMLAGCGDLDWRNIVVLLTDERCVADDSPRSNGRLLRASLLQSHAAVAQYLPIYDHSVGIRRGFARVCNGICGRGSALGCLHSWDGRGCPYRVLVRR